MCSGRRGRRFESSHSDHHLADPSTGNLSRNLPATMFRRGLPRLAVAALAERRPGPTGIAAGTSDPEMFRTESRLVAEVAIARYNVVDHARSLDYHRLSY
jgi:hypothetical protein